MRVSTRASLCEDYSFTFPPLYHDSVAIYTAEWAEASWRDRKYTILETAAKGDLTPSFVKDYKL